MPVRKRFGQHFLHDPGVIRRIIDAVAPRAGERIVEVGPGPRRADLGSARARRAPGRDRDRPRSGAGAREPIRGRKRACACTSRTCSTPISSRLRGAGAPLRIVGNLPYNISTPLLFRLLTQRAAIADMHFMLQKEVVDRMAAQPGTKEYGRLTVMLAAVAEVEASVRRRSRRLSAAPQGVVGHRAPAAHRRTRDSTSAATACCEPW